MALGYRLRGIPPTAEALARNRESPQQPLLLSVARGSIAAEPRGGRGPESPLRLGAAAPRSRGFPELAQGREPCGCARASAPTWLDSASPLLRRRRVFSPWLRVRAARDGTCVWVTARSPCWPVLSIFGDAWRENDLFDRHKATASFLEKEAAGGRWGQTGGSQRLDVVAGSVRSPRPPCDPAILPAPPVLRGLRVMPSRRPLSAVVTRSSPGPRARREALPPQPRRPANVQQGLLWVSSNDGEAVVIRCFSPERRTLGIRRPGQNPGARENLGEQSDRVG